jgi:acyl-CoA synthetase (AMP-forming)/AMP-acid ligase II/acyl carrier protein
MKDEAAILRGAECPVPENATLASIVEELVRKYPLRTVIEIDLKNRARALSVSKIWLNSQAIVEKLRNDGEAGRPVLVICLDSFLDLIAAGWAAIVLDRDCYFWHVIDGHESSWNFASQWRELCDLLGECQLLTRSRLLREFQVDWETEARQPICLDRLPNPKEQHDDLFDRNGDRGKIYVKTSGTTGTGKLAILPFAVQLARTCSAKLVQHNLISISKLPMDNITGISSQILTSNLQVLINPATVAIDPLAFLKAIERFGVQSVAVSTSFASRLIQTLQGQETPLDLSSIRRLGVGLEPIATRVILQLIVEFEKRGAANVRVSCGYGLTEVGRAAFSRDLEVSELRAHRKENSEAFPLATCAPGRAIRVVDAAGQALGENLEGEIQIYAPQRTIPGYARPGGELVPVKETDGWVDSGDIGKISSRGLVIMGRSKGIIFSEGKCISLDPVEQKLRDSGMVQDGLVAAAPLESDEEASSYVVLFCPASENEVVETIRRVQLVATSAIGVRPVNIVALPKDRFVFTTTGKMRKRHMAQLYGRDGMAQQATPSPSSDGDPVERDPLFGRIRDIWSAVLQLDGKDPFAGNFFELGGDSIKAMSFLYQAEQALKVRLPAERFFADLTLKQVWKLFCNDNDADTDDLVETGYCLDRLKSHVREWQGQRIADDAFLRGFHTKGTGTPIFWVFQNEKELLSLAEELGDNQPLYGMRSLNQVVRIRDLSDPILREVSNQYLTELLAITQGKPFVLGGNCQAAVVAFRMAQALEHLGHPAETLFLMEWTSSWGRYAKPVVLLYGKRSYTAKVYESPGSYGLPWMHDFENAVVLPIEGAHREFFNPENISSLSERLLEVTRSESGGDTGFSP